MTLKASIDPIWIFGKAVNCRFTIQTIKKHNSSLNNDDMDV